LYVGRHTVAVGTRSQATYPCCMAALPRNEDVAGQFDLLADLLELEGAESFRVLAYRRAATRMRETSGSIAQLALDGRAKELQGIGKTIEEKIVQIVEQGEIEALAKRRATVPPEVVSFMRLPGLGPKTAARIWKELGVTTLAELKGAAESEQLRGLAGLGAKSEEKILKALAFQADNPDAGRRLLGVGLPAVQAVVSVLRDHPAAVHVSEAGSVRRRKETFRDLDIIATATDPAELTSYFTQLPWVVEVVAHGDTKATVLSNEGLRFDLRVVPPESYGNLLQHFTGSKDHNVALREDAVRRGLSISEYGVTTVETGEVFKTEDEDALYEYLGYQPIPPELRESSGELDAARRRELPALVELADLRGDLHTHTHWSQDGKSTLEQMIVAALARGYEYYAVTDHSHYLREGRLAAQLEEIEQMRARYPKLHILAGVEANIRSNGEVDVPDDELAALDWVVASVHNAPHNRPTERVLEALDNPYVDCIGHLTGRRIGTRGPRDVDVARVIEKALEVGCFLEINGQPDRLDLQDVHARAAKEAGLKLVVNSDAHQVAAQGYVELGIGQARRGWLTAEDVANTRTWKQLDRLRRGKP
jgi:DNA polymerase (family X)